MNYDFDRIIDRRNTASMKWDLPLKGRKELLPLWVADMDFSAPPRVVAALEERAAHGIYGYPIKPEPFYQAVIRWFRSRHGWDIKREWIATAPGVVPAVNIAIQAFTRPGDRIIIQPPVYYPFEMAIRKNRRVLVENPLILEGGRYRMDYSGLKKVVDQHTRLLILCSPHNPVGRVWQRQELEQLVEICLDHEILIVSDEIHADLTLNGHRHTPTAVLSEEAARISITCTAASKTFNLAGLTQAQVFISDLALRKRFQDHLDRVWIDMGNIFGILATETAYTHGADWLDQLLRYIEDNLRFLIRFLEEHLPQVKVLPLEGTYLAWLDFRPLGLSDPEINARLLDRARVWLDEGGIFGSGGEGFQRINLACPKVILAEGLERIAAALADLS